MRLLSAAFVIALFSSACGGPSAGASSTLVGAACTTDNQCQHTCVTSGHFPGGMCTVRCTSDNDCPANSACIEEEGGICAVTCLGTNDCADFGRGYVCDSVDRYTKTGKINVCRLP